MKDNSSRRYNDAHLPQQPTGRHPGEGLAINELLLSLKLPALLCPALIPLHHTPPFAVPAVEKTVLVLGKKLAFLVEEAQVALPDHSIRRPLLHPPGYLF